MFIDVVDASAEVFGSSASRSDGQRDAEVGVGEPTMNQEQLHPQRDLPG